MFVKKGFQFFQFLHLIITTEVLDKSVNKELFFSFRYTKDSSSSSQSKGVSVGGVSSKWVIWWVGFLMSAVSATLVSPVLLELGVSKWTRVPKISPILGIICGGITFYSFPSPLKGKK